MNNNPNPIREDITAGRNSVMELLKSSRQIETLLVTKGELKGSVLKIIAMAKDKGIPVKEVSPVKLDSLAPGVNHQGIVAIASAYEYSSIDDIFEKAGDKPPFIIIADEIEDPHNLGAIIRTAEAAGAHGLIIPKRRGAGLTMIVAKTSAGAVEHLPVARVANLASTIEDLKKRGVWIYGASMIGKPWSSTDFSGPVALVIGSEGDGIGKLIGEKCDFHVSLPMLGKVNSLNASVAAGIIMYEIARQRIDKGL